jgi:hypothetical protein
MSTDLQIESITTTETKWKKELVKRVEVFYVKIKAYVNYQLLSEI